MICQRLDFWTFDLDERHSIHLNSSDESNSSPVEFASSDEGANTLLLSPTLSLADLAVAEVEQENDDDKKKLESSEKEHDRTEESFKELSSGKEKKHLPIKSSSGARTSRAKSDPSSKYILIIRFSILMIGLLDFQN